ncbi:uncharacterized protein Tco025E_00568 [Trypanosoma conorhini]|uniref:RING-type domain-containing protein n=1 Tax=Trypanosoma conorhini TaxID=83891 RepID=A0A3S5IUP8_9TRYP|nr:uncharacterized protein Tco025E_00568 [Trypanosoma conorhini]RNF27194.1 hypothetical protein Tco025E_00568 [Trypanosoma conorhini]
MFPRICCAVAVLTAITTVATAGEAALQSRCASRPIYYASECLEMEECAWCCEKPVGRQCFDKLSSASSAAACAAYAIVNNTNTTCGALCDVPHGDCESCEERNWCYFCISSSMCQPPYASCANGKVIQSCSMREKRDGNATYYFEIVVSVGGALMLLSFLGGVVLLSLQARRQQREEEPQLDDEGTPFLRDAGSAEDAAIARNDAAAPSTPAAAAADAAPPPTSDTPAANHSADEDNTNDNAGLRNTTPSGAGGDDGGRSGPVAAEAAVGSPAAHGVREGGAAEVHLLTPRSAKVSTTDEDSVCFLCLESSPSVTFLPCYHTCCCEECSNKLRPTRGDVLTCPFCRTKIEAMVSLHSVLAHAGL